MTIWRGRIGDANYDKKEFRVVMRKLTAAELEKILRFYIETGRI